MADGRREAERITESIEQQGVDEQGRGVAAHSHGAGTAGQADIGIAGPESVAVEATRRPGVGAQEALDREHRAQATAQVFTALEADEAGGHVATVNRSGGLGARRLDAADREVNQAEHLDRRLGLHGGGGQSHQRHQGNQGERTDGRREMLHVYSRSWMIGWSNQISADFELRKACAANRAPCGCGCTTSTATDRQVTWAARALCHSGPTAR